MRVAVLAIVRVERTAPVVDDVRKPAGISNKILPKPKIRILGRGPPVVQG